MTPPRLVELECPRCGVTHWKIDPDHAGFAGPDVPRAERSYRCPHCGHDGAGHQVKRLAPPAFLLQPHPVYPMAVDEFRPWLAVLREHFPAHPLLPVLGTFWYPGKERPDHARRLVVRLKLQPPFAAHFSQAAVALGRPGLVVQKHGGGEATFWLEPRIELDQSYLGFSPSDVADATTAIAAAAAEIAAAWARYALDVGAFRRESLALLGERA
jgi:hypothetical protein